jgi:YVTN family beta-propeller protein
VGNNGSNNVTKLNATTGKVLGTFASGNNPFGIAFDGANVWVSAGGFVSKF